MSQVSWRIKDEKYAVMARAHLDRLPLGDLLLSLIPVTHCVVARAPDRDTALFLGEPCGLGRERRKEEEATEGDEDGEKALDYELCVCERKRRTRHRIMSIERPQKGWL